MVHRLLITVALVLSPSLAVGATFVVNSTLDAVDAELADGVCATAGGVCTLRAAVQEANALSGAHVITLPAGTYLLTIPGRGELSAATGDLNVDTTLTINGDSTATTIIDANGLDRVFLIFSGGLTLNDLTVQNGNPGDGSGGGIVASGVNLTLARVVVKSCNSGTIGGSGFSRSGGGIFASGPSTVTLTDTTITQNTSTGNSASSGGGVYLVSITTATLTRTTISSNSASFGGGIVAFGSMASPSTLTLTDTTVTQNVAATGHGGGVYLSGPTTTMIRATISRNSSGLTGGGIFVFSPAVSTSLALTDTTIRQNNTTGSGGGLSVSGPGTATISRTTFSGNSASQGGGISLSGGTATLSNTTISGNTATSSSGGAIFTGGGAGSAMTLVNVTIASNSSAFDGAVRSSSPGQLELRNTIIANSTGAAPANCSFSGVVTNLGNNLEFPGTECGFGLASDRRADPLLRALAANGGATETQALGLGSAAIDAGDDASCAAAPVAGVDQRGSSRPTGAHCDIGAYEGAIVPFTDDPLVETASVIRAMHITELRARINAIRVRFGLSAITWTDENLTGVTVQALHIQEMRSALLAAYSAATRTPPSFADPTLVIGGTVIRASHIAELRAAVVALE